MNLQLFPTKLFWLSFHLSVARFQVKFVQKDSLSNDVHRRRESQESICYLPGRLQDQNALPSSSQNGPFDQCPSHPLPGSLKSVGVTCIRHARFIYLNMQSSSCRCPRIVPPLVLGAQFHVEQQSAICCTLPRSISSCLMQCLSCGSLASGSGGSNSPV